MATNLFSRAAIYRKKHPGMTMPEAVKACSKSASKKPAVRKKVATKKKAAVSGAKKRHTKKAVSGKPSRKIKIKVKKTKGGVVNMGISGISMNKIHHELEHQHEITKEMDRLKLHTKEKGHPPAHIAKVKRDITHIKNAIAASKKHITALKRSI